MQQQRQYVGIDFHRRRSVIVRKNEAGELLSCVSPCAISVATSGAQPTAVVKIDAGSDRKIILDFSFKLVFDVTYTNWCSSR